MLRGKSVIELTDVKTNKKEVYEDENLVTNAVPDLLKLNPSGMMYPIQSNKSVEFGTEIFPIANKCYGGILLFENPLEEALEKYIAPIDNEIIGYASNDVNSTDAPKRGSANLTESTPLENGYKFVWDFSTSQANGKISSLALTHYKGGRHFYGDAYGREAYLRLNYTYENVKSEMLRIYLGMVEADVANNTFISIWPRENKNIEIIKFKEPLSTVGVNDTILTETPQIVEKTTLNIEQFYKEINQWYECDFFDGRDGFWYGFATNSNSRGDAKLNRIKIHKKDYSTKVDQWVLENVQLDRIGRFPSSEDVGASRQKYSALKGEYLYTMNFRKDILYKININNPVDVTKIELNFKSLYTEGEDTNSYIYESGDYLVGYDFVFNSKTNGIIKSKGCKFSGIHTPLIEIGPFRIGYGSYTGYGSRYLYKNLYLHTPYLGTINNLSSPILKTADKTMKITYTLTEEP